jgi:Domain of unknown function (DUF6916)
MITRRNFIEMLGLTTVSGLSLTLAGKAFGQTFQPDDLFSLPSASLYDPLMQFTGAHFKPFINSEFPARLEGARRIERLMLLEVKELERKKNLAKGFTGESFSLMFASKRDTPLAGNLFEFNHPSLGAFSLMLAAVGDEPNRYEAIINHLRE